jgi:hypothetical protein
VRACDLDLCARQMQDGAGIDNEPGHWVPRIG